MASHSQGDAADEAARWTREALSRAAAAYGNTMRCPGCDDRGPHEDNGQTGVHRSLSCARCGLCFDPVVVVYP